MHIKKIYNDKFWYIALSIFLISSFVHPCQKQELPRSFGPLVLGMSVEAFKLITGYDPASIYCASCQEGELVAGLHTTREAAKRFGETYFESSTMSLKYQPKYLMPESILCYFYNKKLYSIHMIRIKGDGQSVISKYETALGKPSRIEGVFPSGSAPLWEDSSTRLTVSYEKEPARSSYMEIWYEDLDIMRQMPPHREIK